MIEAGQSRRAKDVLVQAFPKADAYRGDLYSGRGFHDTIHFQLREEIAVALARAKQDDQTQGQIKAILWEVPHSAEKVEALAEIISNLAVSNDPSSEPFRDSTSRHWRWLLTKASALTAERTEV